MRDEDAFTGALPCASRLNNPPSAVAGTGVLREDRGPTAAAPVHRGKATILLRSSLWLASILAVWATLDVIITGLCSPVIPASDAPIYHLYFAVRWWQSGSLEIIPTPFGDSAAPYFPASGDVWFVWLMLPWSSELVAKVGQWPFLWVAMAAIYGLARELSERWEAASFPAVLWGTGSLPLANAGFADVDLIMAAWYLVATWFLFRYGHAHRLTDLAVSGLATGAALGTKYIALLFVPALILAALVFMWRTPKRMLHFFIFASCVIVPAIFWYARNFWLTGNPLYPMHLDIWGMPVLRGWYRRETLLASEYHLDVSDWRSLLQILLRGANVLLVPLWFSGLGALLWAAGKRRWLAALVGLGTLHVVLFWWVNPYQTQDRFLFAAFALAAVPIAIAVDRVPVLAALSVILIAANLVMGSRVPAKYLEEWYSISLMETAVPLLPSPLLILSTDGSLRFGPLARGPLWMLAALACAWLLWTGSRNRRSSARLWQLGAILVAAIGVGYRANQAMIPRGPFRFYPVSHKVGYTGGWLALGQASQRPVRVAYTGTNLPFYLFGQGLRNQVQYVNITEHTSHRMHDYHELFASRGESLARSSTPDWDRREPDEDAWLQNLRDQQIELLFIGWRIEPGKSRDVYDSEGFVIERSWADRHPDIFRLIHVDRRTRLYGVRFP